MRLIRLLLALCLLLPVCSLAAGVAVGDIAPEVELIQLPEDGSSASLSSLRGKVVYLDFWASWCGPCRLSFPQLEAMRTELRPRGFEVFAINVDEIKEDALRFLAELPVSYPVVHDAAGDTPAKWGILGMPTGFLIDREGTVRKVHTGYRKSDGVALRAEILKLLEE
ncbi:MAG: thiol-disulfide isomerase/thioredoxin [Halioglobus sp.]|jgi:thiol-disulfide isomerase/thioredoxin